MTGIILAGGTGTRLHPLTKVVSKQLLPVYNKPMIYYPLSVLMLAGIKEIMIITTPDSQMQFKSLLGNGEMIGIKLRYAIQYEALGIADAFRIAGREFENTPVMLILGDNILQGNGLHEILKNARKSNNGATIFTMTVKDPSRYGVAEFDENGAVRSLEEKPESPRSNQAVIGLYILDSTVWDHVNSLKPSLRGELEITDLNNIYLNEGKLNAIPLGRGFAWFDAGTHESLSEAGQFVRIMEETHRLKVSCIEEVAWRMGFIDDRQLEGLAMQYRNSSYGEYLYDLLD